MGQSLRKWSSSRKCYLLLFLDFVATRAGSVGRGEAPLAVSGFCTVLPTLLSSSLQILCFQLKGHPLSSHSCHPAQHTDVCLLWALWHIPSHIILGHFLPVSQLDCRLHKRRAVWEFLGTCLTGNVSRRIYSQKKPSAVTCFEHQSRLIL